jgi:hypothetical protein
MVERSLRGKVAIVGIGETTYPGAAEDGGTSTVSPPIATIATIRRRLVAGLGVEGDAHLGKSVQYRSRVARDPSWSAQSVHSARAHSAGSNEGDPRARP